MLYILFKAKQKTEVKWMSIYFIILSVIVILFSIASLNKEAKDEIVRDRVAFRYTLIVMFLLHLIPNCVQILYVRKRDHGEDEWNRDFTYKGRIVDVIGGCIGAQLFLLIVTSLAVLIHMALANSINEEIIALITVKYIFTEGYLIWILYHYRQEIQKEGLSPVTDNSNDEPSDQNENK
ncbi:hypothetical protein C0J52_12626 [Blattella germanica]|nr:hypothetical protein C0J52_12626 [Blattella germanica]